MNDTITRELVDLLWPNHDRTSCSDDNLMNRFPREDRKWASRCNRCMALKGIGCPVDEFEIEATIHFHKGFKLTGTTIRLIDGHDCNV